MTEKPVPRIGLGVLITNGQGQILFSQRLGQHAHGTWCAPGGWLEFGETIEEGAIRETREETGLEIDNIKIITFTQDFHKEENKHVVTFFVTGRVCGGSLTNPEPEKHTPWEWHDIDNLPRPLLMSYENMFKQNLPLKEILKQAAE